MILFGNYGETGYAPYQGRITNLAIFGKKHLRLFLSIDGVDMNFKKLEYDKGFLKDAIKIKLFFWINI
jgi:hypothetical protein